MKSLFKIAQSVGVMRSGRTAPDALKYTIVKTGVLGKAAVFTIGTKLHEEMRWMVGDRLDVLYDPVLAEGQLVRCKEGGWSITGKNPNGPYRVRLNLRPEFELPVPEKAVDLAYESTNTTIAFAFPIQYRKPIKLEKKG